MSKTWQYTVFSKAPSLFWYCDVRLSPYAMSWPNLELFERLLLLTRAHWKLLGNFPVVVVLLFVVTVLRAGDLVRA